MNTRPTRAPAPTAEPTDTGIQWDTAPANNLPAERQQQSGVAEHSTAPPTEHEPVTLPKTGFAALTAAIASVMAEIKPVDKTGWNNFHRYSYARMQDLSAELTPLMGKHGIVIFQNELNRDMFDQGQAMAVRYQFTIVHRSGEIWPERPVITGVSMCRTTNGKYDDKAFNKCHTSARKYFLLSLFQIPTDDTEDSDRGENGENRPRPQGGKPRPAPAPDGKMVPHVIAIVDGEAPEAWGKRFKAFIDKAETSAEVDKWYDANASVFDKLKGRYQAAYDDLIDAMDARVAKLDGKPADTITTGKPPESDFPGDKKPGESGIPLALRRTITEDEREWIEGLNGAFSGCEDQDSLQEKYEELMGAWQDKVSKVAWDRACEVHDENIQRIESNGD